MVTMKVRVVCDTIVVVVLLVDVGLEEVVGWVRIVVGGMRGGGEG